MSKKKSFVDSYIMWLFIIGIGSLMLGFYAIIGIAVIVGWILYELLWKNKDEDDDYYDD